MAETSTKLGRVSLVPRGEYDATETYNRLDIVEHEGSSYLVLADGTTGVTPAAGTFYMLVAEKGDTGATGPIGATGPQGIQGKKGDTGDIGPAGPKGDTGEQGQKGDMGETGPAGPKGDTGDTGNGIASIERTSGTGAAGTTDTYTITMTDGSTATFQVYNGADGTGAGDMLKSVYDPQNKNTDIFSYVDKAVSGVEINVDADPTDGSPNPVSSGGTFSALATKQPKLTGQAGQVVGFGADGAAVAVQGWSNPNLLPNWDFRNPVNRNGQTEYAQGGFTIDMWCGSNCSVRMEDGGIVVSQLNNSSDAHFYMPSFSGKFLTGKTVTLSVIVDEIDGTCNINGFGAVKSLIPGINFLTATAEEESGFWILNYLNGTIKIRAAKLELGPVQTLARQDTDGNWVLNDPPDYALQYALCSLYSPSTGEWVGSQHSNLNLLDNWYFADPINQRGQNEYTGDYAYGLDRWRQHNIRYTVGSQTVTILTAGEDAKFYQTIESNRVPSGAVCTFSVIVDGELYYVTGDDTVSLLLNTPFGVLILWKPYNGIERSIELRFKNLAEGESVVIQAAKLELGSRQTLAHRDASGRWVLNDPPPNKALELAKCRRYFRVIKGSAYLVGVRGFSNKKSVLVSVQGEPMRCAPTPILRGLSNIVASDGTRNVNITSASAASDSFFSLNAELDTLDAGTVAVYCNDTIWLDSNL